MTDSATEPAPPEQPGPRVVVGVACGEAAPAFAEVGLRFEDTENWSECASRLHEPGVRALVVQPTAEGDDLAQLVGRIRQEAPLLDVLVWAPERSAEHVRLALQEGAADVVLARDPRRLAKAVLRTIERQKFLPRLQRFKVARSRTSRFEGLVSKSARMWELFETVVQIAPSGASVLVLGETGVGKELLARAIHKYSARTGPFVAVNCGAIPEQLVDSELFGHEEGTFTGATESKPGLFRVADEGTLFLDEIGNLPLGSQYSLLRALQEEAVRPVGGQQEIPVDVRVIAATSLPLDEEVQRGSFRGDLLFRLDVIRLVIPPLRERPEDVIHLFGYFRRKYSKQYRLDPPNPSDAFLEALLAYDWPGNVRELENLSERLVLTHHGKRLTRRQFEALKRPYPRRPQVSIRPPSSRLTPPSPEPRADVDPTRTLKENLDPWVAKLERAYLDAVLRRTQGRVGETARVADISPRTLLRKMKKYGLDKGDYRAVSGDA